MRLVQSMYKDVRSRERVCDGYSEEFGVGVGVHQSSVRFSSSLYKRLYQASFVQAFHGSSTQMT